MTTTTSETKEERNNILVGGMKGWERKQDVIEKQLLFPLLWMKSPLKGSWSFTETLLLHILLTLPGEEEDLPVTWQWTEEETVVDLLARYRSPVMDDYLLIHVRKPSVEDFSTLLLAQSNIIQPKRPLLLENNKTFLKWINGISSKTTVVSIQRRKHCLPGHNIPKTQIYVELSEDETLELSWEEKEKVFVVITRWWWIKIHGQTSPPNRNSSPFNIGGLYTADELSD